MGIVGQGLYRRQYPGDARFGATRAFPTSWPTMDALGVV